jgi:hypothetical protein
VPVPDRLTVCGLPPPLSVMDALAVRLPFAEGVNVTLMKQLAPEARLDPQLLVWAKSPELLPVIEMLVMLTDVLPLFVIVIFFGRLVVPTGWLPKLILVGES